MTCTIYILTPPRLKRRIQKRQNHIITHTLHSLQNPGSPQKPPLKTKPTNLRSPHTSHINTHPKPISQATSAHIRSSSLNPHQHTSEALLSSHISIHPKLITQPSSSHIRSSSLKSHKTVTKTPDINQPVNQANHLFP